MEKSANIVGYGPDYFAKYHAIPIILKYTDY
jgi:hypothetical protein